MKQVYFFFALFVCVSIGSYTAQAQMNESKFLASDAKANDFYGYSVSTHGNYAAVGAYSPNDTGAVYVYHYDGSNWSLQQTLTASDQELGDYFGFSVDITYPRIIVGAHWDDDDGSGSGAAYIYYHDGSSWTEEQKNHGQ